MMTAEIDSLIRDAEEWLRFHKRRGSHGRIEALAAQIRLRALRDAKAAMEAKE